MSTTSFEVTALETSWLMAESSVTLLSASVEVALTSAARTAWKKPTSSRMCSASSPGTASAKALESADHGAVSRFLPSS